MSVTRLWEALLVLLGLGGVKGSPVTPFEFFVYK